MEWRYFFLCLFFLSLETCTASSLSILDRPNIYKFSIRYHGSRLHIRVLPTDTSLIAHVTEASVCSAVDLNLQEFGCKTPGFTNIVLITQEGPKTVTKINQYQTRLESSKKKFSIKPVTVIQDWPLVYIDVCVKFKQVNGKWLNDGECFRAIERIDKADKRAGSAMGMNPMEGDPQYTWKVYILMGVAGCFICIALISMVKRSITNGYRKAMKREAREENLRKILRERGNNKLDAVVGVGTENDVVIEMKLNNNKSQVDSAEKRRFAEIAVKTGFMHPPQEYI